MGWKIIRRTPADKNNPARDIPSVSNIFLKKDAEEIAARYESWAAAGDGAKFIVVEEEPEKL